MMTKLWDLFWEAKLTWWPKFKAAAPAILIYLTVVLLSWLLITSCAATTVGAAGTVTAVATAPAGPAVQIPATIAVSSGVAELLHSAQQVTAEPVTDIWGLMAQIWNDIWWGILLVVFLFWAVPSPLDIIRRVNTSIRSRLR